MGMIVGWLFLVIAIVAFQFFWWRRLAEDYEKTTIVGMGWALAVVYLAGGVIGVAGTNRGVGTLLGWWRSDLFSGVWGLIAAQIVFGWAAWIRDWKVWAVGEEVFEGFYWLTAVVVLVQWIWGGGKAADVLITIGALMVFRYIKANYRKWVWYPSGRKGFAFLAVNSLYLLAVGVSWGMGGAGEVVEMVKLAIMPVGALILGIGLVILGRQ